MTHDILSCTLPLPLLLPPLLLLLLLLLLLAGVGVGVVVAAAVVVVAARASGNTRGHKPNGMDQVKPRQQGREHLNMSLVTDSAIDIKSRSAAW